MGRRIGGALGGYAAEELLKRVGECLLGADHAREGLRALGEREPRERAPAAAPADGRLPLALVRVLLPPRRAAH
eukprot:3139802-Rhodomonas_salina.1